MPAKKSNAKKSSTRGKSTGGRKLKPTPTFRLGGRWNEHGEQAHGHSQLKPGFGFTEEWDVAWALGFPFIRFLDEEHESGKDPEKFVLENRFLYEYQLVLAPAAAHRYLRYFCGPTTGTPAERLQAAAKDDRPVEPEEFREGIARHVVECKLWKQPAFFRSIAYFAEVLHGSRVTTETLLAILRSLPLKTLRGPDTNAARILMAVTSMLLRVPGEQRTELVAELRSVFDSVGVPGELEQRTLQMDMDFFFNGQEAMHRHLENMNISLLLFLQDAPELVSSTVLSRYAGKARHDPCARYAFLGGDPVIDLEREWMKGYTKEDTYLLTWIAQYGQIRSPVIVELMVGLSLKSPVRKAADGWIAAHAEYARPVLDELARHSGPLPEHAKGLLERLD